MREISQQGRAQPEWCSYHIFHSLSGDPVLRGLVLPAVRELWSSQRFLRFFFIRYGEGGLHVRLRFLCRVEEDRQEIAATLATRAAEFFDLGDDAAGRIIAAPFEPETERYGGTELLGHSLDFFCLSSVHTLQQVERHQDKPRLLALALRTLVRQALGFVSEANELARLTAYTVNGDWKRRTPLEERADREFEGRREDYLRLLAEEIEGSFQSGARRLTDMLLAEGALLLSQLTRGADGPVRWRIQSSQLHMTWNRMGIRNLEEIYLGRILWRAVRHALDARDDLRSALAAALARRQIQSQGGFETLIGESLAQLAKPYSRKLSERRRKG